MPAQTQVLIIVAWSLGFFALTLLGFALFALARQSWGVASGRAGRNGHAVDRQLAFAAPAGEHADELRGRAPGTTALGVTSEASAADALNSWEDEGGSVPPPAPEALEREPDGGAPTLPAGHLARLAWGFVDQGGRFAYEFFRVYGPAGHLVPNLSYWAVRSRPPPEDADDPWSNWRMTFARARELAGPELTFERFSSPAGMPSSEFDCISSGPTRGSP
jgi:hypothetical protein